MPRKSRQGGQSTGRAAPTPHDSHAGQSVHARRAGARSPIRASRESHSRAWLRLGLLAAAVAAAYANSLGGQFILDDSISIVENQAIRRLWPLTDFLASPRPLVDYTLAINYALHGLNPAGYHAVNLAVHILAAWTLLALVCRAADRVAPGGRWSGPALAVALLWAVHPLQTQAVTYVIQRAESMMGLFYLLALYCTLRAAGAVNPRRLFLAAVAASAAGMASKAVMVTVPLAAMLFDRVFLATSWREVLRSRWMLHAGLMATWLVLGAFGVVSGLFATRQDDPITVGFGITEITPWEYLRTQPEVILHYIRLAFVPVGQCVDYGWPVARDAGRVAAAGGAVLALLAASLWALRRRPWIGFLGVCFFLILSPTSSFVPIRDIAFEHRMYLSLACLVALVVFTARAGLVQLTGSAGAGRAVAIGLTLAAAAALSVLTHRRNALYCDTTALWTENLVRTPHHPRVHNALGCALSQAGRIDEAIAQFNEALRLDPNFPGAWANLGVANMQRGDSAAAVEQIHKAFSLSPHEFGARTYFYLGSALLDVRRYDEARERFENALELRPDYHEARCNLGNALKALGRLAEAEAILRRTIADAPQYAAAWASLADVLEAAGRPADAAEAFERALAMYASTAPRDTFTAHLHVRLGRLRLAAGRRDDARRHFQAALAITPDDPAARAALAETGP
jgi:tetratricopeptide (TPR) repeat protein